MKEEIRNTIQQYLKSYYNNDFENMISLLYETETKNYVNQFIEFTIKMDHFGETDDFLNKIDIENLDMLSKISTEEFMTKILNLTKQEIGNDEMNKIVSAIEISNIELDDNLATVKYEYPVSYFGEKQILKSKMKLTKQDNQWKIHFKSRLDQKLSSLYNEIDAFYQSKSQDKIKNLNHHVNDLEKVTLVGYKNMNGDIVFQPRFKEGGEFSDGYAYVKVISKYGYIDKTGEIVIKPQFEYVKNFSEDLAGVKTPNSQHWSFINKKGEIVIEPRFDQVSEFNEGLCAVEINGKWGYINSKGKFIIECQFEEANDFWSDETDVIRLNKHGELETIYINKKGEIIEEE